MNGNLEGSLVKWKILVVFFTGILIISVGVKAGTTKTGYISGDSKSVSKGNISMNLKMFAGKNAPQEASEFLRRYGDRLTLRVDLTHLSNIHFVGISIRPLSNGMYIPTYYISADENITLDRKHFERYASASERAKLTAVASVGMEPERNFKKIGTIIWREKKVKVCKDTWHPETCVNVSHKVKADFWYATTTSGQYDYYVFTKHEAEVPNIREQRYIKVAVDSVQETINILNEYDYNKRIQVFISDYIPYGSGQSKEATKTWGINIGAGAAPEFPYILPTVSAGFSETSSDGLNFRWYVSSEDPNGDVTFKFYNLRKGNSPAWGDIFRSTTLTIITVKPQVAFHEGDVEITAKAQFVGEYKKLYCPPLIYTGCTSYELKTYKDAPDIKIKVEMYPWFILEKE